MSLYYELDPADDNDPPLLPPILTPVAVPDKIDVFNKAIAKARNSEAGTVFYSESTEFVELAVVLNPEVKKIKCNQMFYVMMVAAGDSIGSLAPPEVVVSYSYPGLIFLNQGEAGLVKIEVSPSARIVSKVPSPLNPLSDPLPSRNFQYPSFSPGSCPTMSVQFPSAVFL